jgi:hypothetical protein
LKTGYQLLAALLLLIAPLHASATTLLTLTLDELVSQSALIFVAEVKEVAVVETDGQVYTYVTFQTAAEIKGSVAEAPAPAGNGSNTLTLRFLGGSTPGFTLEVSGNFIPAQGDRGLYFVEAADHTMVNPLTGWRQGAFPLFTAADGVDYIDLRGHPDYAEAFGAANPLAAKMRALGFSAEQIDAKFPDTREFPLEDFVRAITYLLSGGN